MISLLYYEEYAVDILRSWKFPSLTPLFWKVIAPSNIFHGRVSIIQVKFSFRFIALMMT